VAQLVFKTGTPA